MSKLNLKWVINVRIFNILQEYGMKICQWDKITLFMFSSQWLFQGTTQGESNNHQRLIRIITPRYNIYGKTVAIA